MAFTPSVIYYDGYISKNVLYSFPAFPDIKTKNVYSVYTDGYVSDEGHTLPEKQECIFLGWSQYINGNSEIISKDAVFNDLTCSFDLNADGTYYIYAVWKSLTTTITFNSTTGTFPSNSTITKSVQVNLDGTISLSTLVEFPTKSGYVFKGWSTTNTGNVVYAPYATPTITEDTTLYAVWEKAESYLVREDTLVNIANAVRSKTGGIDAIALNDMATIISALGPTISANGDTLTITN